MYFSWFEPSHEIIVLFVPRKLVLQTRMRSHPVGARYLIFGQTHVYFHTLCANSEGSGETAQMRRWGSGETAQMRRLAWAFAGRLCDKYHNLMS